MEALTHVDTFSGLKLMKPGSKATYITAPIIKKIRPLEGVSDHDKPTTQIIGFRLIPVFIIEDTDGEPVEKHDHTPPVLPPLFDVVQKLGLKVSYQPFNGRALGSYNPVTQQINLSVRDSFVYYEKLIDVIKMLSRLVLRV
jgi:hypothetical protein